MPPKTTNLDPLTIQKQFAGPSGVLDPEIDIPNHCNLADLQYAASMPAYSGSKIGS